MASWVRTDVEFGVPMLGLAVPVRDVMLQLAVRQSHEDKDVTGLQAAVEAMIMKDVTGLQAAVEAMILRARPNLAGMTLYAMSLQPERMMWRFLVIHPLLPRLPFGERERCVWLNPCAACGKDMDADAKVWLRMVPETFLEYRGPTEVVCSEACSRPVSALDAPTVVKEGWMQWASRTSS